MEYEKHIFNAINKQSGIKWQTRHKWQQNMLLTIDKLSNDNDKCFHGSLIFCAVVSL